MKQGAEKTDKTRALFSLEGNPGLGKVLPYSIQQILAMFVTNMVPIGIIGAACVPALTQAEILALMQSAMIAAGLATFIQATPIWKLGSGLPIFMGVSFTFVIPLSTIAAKYGYGAVTGTVLVGGLFEGVLGLTVKYWKKIMAPIVSAVVVTGIGLSLLSTAARSFGGGYAEDFGSVPNIITGTVTLLCCLLWMVLVKGSKKQLSILIGLAAGYLTALLFGHVDFSALKEGSFFSLPRLLPFTPVFRFDAILSVGVIYLVSATETLGDASAIAGGVLRRTLTQQETTGVLTIDGLGSVFSGLLGGTPVTSYSENVGLTIMTGVVNRNVARVGGAIMILAGLFPPVSHFMGTIPKPVIGGVLLIVLGQILVSGFEMIGKAGFTTRNKLIAAISLSVGIGFTASTEAGIWSNFPVAIQSIFAQNVVSVVFVLALVLNLVLPQDMDEKRA
ncbi:MAG: purine/pyrimidine permease [Oscillospiraceae bacterium]|nr:purine/pyrimidine permease [Oscillospiraceae bacterium]